MNQVKNFNNIENQGQSENEKDNIITAVVNNNELSIPNEITISNIVKEMDEKYKNSHYVSMCEHLMFLLFVITNLVSQPNEILINSINGYFLLNSIILSKMIYNKLSSNNKCITLGNLFEIFIYNISSLLIRQPIALFIASYLNESKYKQISLYKILQYKIFSAKQLTMNNELCNEKDKITNQFEYNFNNNEIIPIIEYYNLAGLKINKKNEIATVLTSTIILFLFPFNLLWIKSYYNVSFLVKSFLSFGLVTYMLTYYNLIKGHYKKTKKINLFDIGFLGIYSFFINIIYNPILSKTVDFLIENDKCSNVCNNTVNFLNKISNFKIYKKSIIANEKTSNNVIDIKDNQ